MRRIRSVLNISSISSFSSSLFKSNQSKATEAVEVPGDDNNNPPEHYGGETTIKTLSATSAALVGEFYRKLQGTRGKVLGRLLRGDICLGGNVRDVDYPLILEKLSQVCHFLHDELKRRIYLFRFGENLEWSISLIDKGPVQNGNMNPLPKLIKKSDLSMDRLTFS